MNRLSRVAVLTSAGCPAKVTTFYATMRGPGFPPAGQVITANTTAGLSQRIGFDVSVALITLDYAKDSHTTLGGRYEVTGWSVPWLVGAGAVLIVLVVVAVIRKRRLL